MFSKLQYGDKPHGNKNRNLTIGDLIDFKAMKHKRGHLRKILHITTESNRKEMQKIEEMSSDRYQDLKNSNTWITQILKADMVINILGMVSSYSKQSKNLKIAMNDYFVYAHEEEDLYNVIERADKTNQLLNQMNKHIRNG